MTIAKVVLKNWRNFQSVGVALAERVFLAGPNASGKSNFLDVFRFLRDVSKPGGGLQKAVSDRGGVSKLRCLAARAHPDIEIEIHLSDNSNHDVKWGYAIGIKQQSRGYRQPILAYERVWHGKGNLLERPDRDDAGDRLRLTQTHLEQIGANSGFREIAKFFESVLYLHLVPQLVRHPEISSGRPREFENRGHRQSWEPW